ncbi:hypothetical protein WBG78_11635 [Chryseolinea sp. T2]|uniref:hypothetical protein n=1 Tax=Chryseolinea sp. T2 TaxID=3129255 RepID=UPI0030776026
MKGNIVVTLMLAITRSFVLAQQPALLFQDKSPLEISFTAPLSKLKHEDEDSIYFATTLAFRKSDGSVDSIKIGLRARGNFRRKNCSLPPLRIKIHKEDRRDVFTGVKSLKLVVPCQNNKGAGNLLMREYLCYQLYEPVTPYVFKTRLVNVTLIETSGRREVMKFVGFLIEDDDDAARRLQSKVVNTSKVNPFMLQDTCAVRFDLFQFMIGNTDFSTAYFHNTKVLRTKSNVLLPVAYDFDMSGIVSAPYATVDPALGIQSVRERVYRGFCRGEGVSENVRREYLALEPRIMGIVDEHHALFSEKEISGMKRYLKDFFNLIRSDNLYNQYIVRGCRTTN